MAGRPLLAFALLAAFAIGCGSQGATPLSAATGQVAGDYRQTDVATPQRSWAASRTPAPGLSPAPAATATPSPTPTCTIPADERNYRRWNVKVGSDPDASQVQLTPHDTTISKLRALKAPPSPRPQNDRIWPTEFTVFRLTNVKLIHIARSADRDYHLSVQNSLGKTMIVENPDPDCAPCSTSSRFLSQTTSVRTYLDAHYKVTSNGSDPNDTVSLTGVGFWDTLSGAYGQAPNAIELHPVLSICIGANCRP
ncbi:MAG: hypothetical protein GIW99_00750 [Candidatus Eremiobacteraeota bacterium]|nr:hypothetical protein [Candidatus Eremiobacteraeota bacterium]MBC5826214.1 hypothetical protein [Candidatus Eremiobacteraeota bacterium]